MNIIFFIIWVFYFGSVFSDPLTVEVLHNLTRAGNPVACPSGVVFTSRVWDSESGVTTINLVAYAVAGDYPLTSSPGNQDVSPTFSPDGQTVAFLSTRSTPISVYTVPFVSGEDDVALLVTLPVDIDNLLWISSGDDSYLLYTIRVYPDCHTLECTAQRDKEVESRGPNTWKLYDSLFVRHWDKWETGKLSHIFVQKVVQNPGGSWSISGEPRDLMLGQYINSPVPPFGGLEQIDVDPDCTEISFTGEIVNASTAWSTSWVTFVVPLDGSSAPVSITDSIMARTQNPKYSPDGKYLAFLSMNRAGYEADKLHINLYDREKKVINTVTDTIDISFSGIEWDKDSKWVLADADYHNRHLLFAIDMLNLEPKVPPVPIITDGSVSGIIRAGLTEVFYMSSNSMTNPDDLWQFNFTDGQIKGLTQITFLNKNLLMGIELQIPEEFHFTGSNNDEVYGWILKPYGWSDSSSATWPVVNLIHGGPQGSWNDDWSYRWNPQLWTGHGYGVILINFHGSTGFGQDFTDAINHHWGDIPYWDIMNGTIIAVKNNPWMNPNALGACGASYGGYMVNWIQGNTELFKVLVTHDGIFDTFLAYYATEELWFPAWEFDGVPWENPTLYKMWNPAQYVSKWKTPHLIIHGDHDYRLPLSHGLSAFSALQRKGIPSELLYMTLENHWVLKPENGIKWYHTVLDWLDKWINQKPPNGVE